MWTVFQEVFDKFLSFFGNVLGNCLECDGDLTITPKGLKNEKSEISRSPDADTRSAVCALQPVAQY